MNSNWDEQKLGDVVDIITGSTPPRGESIYWEGGDIPWFTIDDIRIQGRIIRSTLQHITSEALNKTSLRLLPKYTTLLCCTASLGECAFTEISLTTNQQFNGLVIKKEYEDRILPKYIFYFASTLKSKLLRSSGKTSFNYVSAGNLKKIKIAIPDLDSQKEIIERLDAICVAQELNVQLITKSDELLDSFFRNSLSNNWAEIELGDALDYEQPTVYIVGSMNYKETYRTPVLTAGKTFVLGMTDETDNIFPRDKLPVIIFDDFTTASKFVDFPFKVKSSAMKILHAKDGKADIRFIFRLMQQIVFAHNRHKRYWISEYSKIKIRLPDIDKQGEIADMLDTIQDYKKILLKQKRLYKELFDTTLHKSLSGER